MAPTLSENPRKNEVTPEDLKEVSLFKQMFFEIVKNTWPAWPLRDSSLGQDLYEEYKRVFNLFQLEIIDKGGLTISEVKAGEIIMGDVDHQSFTIMTGLTNVSIGITQEKTRNEILATIVKTGISLPKGKMVGELGSFKRSKKNRSANVIAQHNASIIEGPRPIHEIIQRIERDRNLMNNLQNQLEQINKYQEIPIRAHEFLGHAAMGYLKGIFKESTYLNLCNIALEAQDKTITVDKPVNRDIIREEPKVFTAEPGEFISIPEGHFIAVYSGSIEIISTQGNVIGEIVRGIIGERIATIHEIPNVSFRAKEETKFSTISVTEKDGKSRSLKNRIKLSAYLVRQLQDKIELANIETQVESDEMVKLDIERRVRQVRELAHKAPIEIESVKEIDEVTDVTMGFWYQLIKLLEYFGFKV